MTIAEIGSGAAAEVVMAWEPLAFRAFGPWHLLAVVVLLALLGAFVGLGRLSRGTPREAMVRGTLAGMAIMLQLMYVAIGLQPDRYNPLTSWPLQLCDLGAFLVPVALLIPGWRVGQTIVFFWGFALTTQAFLTPTVSQGPDDVRYWFYFLQHGLILIAAAYSAAVLGYRPKLRDLGILAAIDIGLLAGIVPLNEIMGVNYFWVGSVATEGGETGTLLDVLGPWPARIGVMYLLAHLIMLVIWGVVKLIPAKPSEPPAEAS